MPKLTLTLCLLCVLSAPVRVRAGASAAAGAVQGEQAMRITVEGTPLTGPFSIPQQRGERLFLPLAAIARALGDVVQFDGAARTVRVRRQTGVNADFDASLNLVRENGATVLVLPGTSDVDFPPQPEALMLPVEITAALLEASVHIDTAARVVHVRRGRALSAPVNRAERRGPLEIFDAAYDYNLDQYPTGFNHNLTLRADGRLFDGRFSLSGNLAGATGHGIASLNTAAFAFERPNGQRLMAGDVGVGHELTFMSSMVRGVWAQGSFGRARVSAFAGRAAGGLFAPTVFAEPLPQATPTPDEREHRPRRQTFDTNVFGAYVTFGDAASGPYRPGALQLTAGAVSFDGPSRRGRLLTGSLRASGSRYALQADFGAGAFAGFQPDGSEVKGAGGAVDLSGSLNLRDNLTVQGRYTFNSRNFMAAQAGSASSLNLKSFGVTWSPKRWLTASLTDTLSARPGRRDSAERFTTATLNLAPRRYLSNLFLSHTRYRTAQVSAGSYTTLSASKSLDRWFIFANASRIRNPGGGDQHAQLGARLRLREADSLQASQTFGSGGTLAGTFDWTTQSILSKRVSLGAGLGYSRSAASPLNFYERLNANVRLPFEQTLQVSYGHMPSGPQLHLSLRGPLLLKRRNRAEAETAGTAEASRYGSVSGRVYQDLNFDGAYEAGVDVPQANVRVRVDGNLSVVTDANGLYRIDRAPAGEHTVALDLLSVRADLTILGEASHAVSLGGGFKTVVDFRTARTGRVAGTVWLDRNANGRQDEGEEPLSDVRVVTSAGRDTLTNEEGQFVIADLAPGVHALVLDAKTLPDDSVVSALAGGSLQVTVKAGAETADIRLAVTPKPPERKQF